MGRDIGLKCLAVVGGIDMAHQAQMLLKKPHIVVATLGRLADHLKHLKGFSLRTVKYLVLDEADRILNQDFEDEMDRVIRALPKQRTTMLFSATITNKVRELQRAHLRGAVKVEVNSSFKLVDTLQQYMISMPFIDRHVYLVYLIKSLNLKSVIVFCNTRANTVKTALILRQCGHTAIPLYGDMSQTKRLEALAKFKKKERSVLVATNVASRGLDIPCVDYVINLEVPTKSEDYIHRVGRTARAGRTGTAITFVSQFEIEDFIRIEHVVMQDSEVKRIPLYPISKNDVLKYTNQISEAERAAKKEMRQIEDIRRANSGGGSHSDDDTEEASGVRKRLKRDDSGFKGHKSGFKNKKAKRQRR
uniref:ATP-dependent RNA helicase DDX47 n=1 Tax=Hirondellea gigas TaxID=1518452 RepID=A0A6A7FTP5_9CRUS